MTREERLKSIQDMDAVIERMERTCQSYELIQMEMMASYARAKALHKQLIARKAENSAAIAAWRSLEALVWQYYSFLWNDVPREVVEVLIRPFTHREHANDKPK